MFSCFRIVQGEYMFPADDLDVVMNINSTGSNAVSQSQRFELYILVRFCYIVPVA